MAQRPAPDRSKTGRSSLSTLYVILGVVAIAGIGFVAYQMTRASAAREPVEVTMDPAELQRVQGISIGEADAPVVIYEFADFQCPACGQFATFVAPLIKENLVEKGIARYVYYDFPLVQIHPNAFIAARAGRCANEQGKFWEYHDVLYGRQSEWAHARNPDDLFVGYARQVGADEAAFERCLKSDRYAEEVTQSMKLGESLRVSGTPSLFVNGKMVQPGNYRELEEIVLAEVGQAPSAGAAQDTAGGAVPAQDTTAAAGAAPAMDTAGTR